jgi:hypothetical protein
MSWIDIFSDEATRIRDETGRFAGEAENQGAADAHLARAEPSHAQVAIIPSDCRRETIPHPLSNRVESRSEGDGGARSRSPTHPGRRYGP